MFLFKLPLILDTFKRYGRRHWIFTAFAVFWILSPFDDFFLPVIDEVLIVLFWLWGAWQEHKNGSKKVPSSKKEYLP